MSISKTRQKLVDVARQLFAKNGIANTTMNDIAKASGKGRRTLYTYFKSKDDVYSAVIESELERLSDKLDEVANKKISPQDKIIELTSTPSSFTKALRANANRCASGKRSACCFSGFWGDTNNHTSSANCCCTTERAKAMCPT